MLKKNALLYIACLAFLSCNYSGKLTKRYGRIKIEENKAKISEYVGVDAYIKETTAADAAKPKTVFDLSERGQKELIKQLGINESASDKLIAALISPLSPKSPSNIDFIDYTRFEKQVIVSISNLSHWPADRVSKLTVRLKIADDFQLRSCNKLTTEYQTLDLGKQTYSNTSGVEVNANVGYGANMVNGTTNANEQSSANKVDELTTGSKSGSTGANTKTITAGIGASGKFNASRSFGEEVQLRQRIIALNASISDNTLTLYQEGISGINLSGNITADIVFDSKKDIKVERVYSFSELNNNGTPNDADKLKVKETLVQFFNFDKDITADLSYDADFRHVTYRGRTTSESDDAVQLYYGTVAPKSIVLLHKDQLRPKLWILFDKRDQVSKKPVKIFSPNTNGNGELIFNSYSDAKDFLAWLLLKSANLVTTNAGKVGIIGHTIFNSTDSPIDIATLQNLQVGVSQ